jgi:hypothetical protein
MLDLGANPDLMYPGPDGRHRLPVAGLHAELHEVQLVSSLPSGAGREVPQVAE